MHSFPFLFLTVSVNWQIFAYFPEPAKCGTPTKVLFVMHGVNRDAEAEFRRNIPLDRAKHNLQPEKHNFVLLVPEFSAELFPSRNNYNFGGIFQVTRHSLFRITAVQ